MTNKTLPYSPIASDVEELAAGHGHDRESMLVLLKELQALEEGLSRAHLRDAARALGVPTHQAYGLATFYSMLSLEQRRSVLRVCDGPACWLKHASKTREALDKNAAGWIVERTSCLGMCDRAPAVLVDHEQAGPVTGRHTAQLLTGWRGAQVDYSEPRRGEKRVLTALLGRIDPDSIEEALANGVYDALKATLQRKPEEVVSQVEASGLQGRGGAGFPVGRKWGLVAAERRRPHYIVCNADESEPLIFKDRVLMETNPHQLLEGMTIAGYACGASEAWIYIRGEYEAQARRLEHAIDQALAKDLLGENILGSGFSFKIHVHRGAGAYICGEETALLESLEGKRGEPRLRPPYPPASGFRGQPTAVNNVESFCAVPHIVKNGADWWRGLNGNASAGTKLYMVLGHVRNPGLFEAPLGLTLRQVIEDYGGGMLPWSQFNLALCGGAAGTIVDESLLDVPLDYSSSHKGISLGAGSFLICDQTVSAVALLRELLHFFAAESCGKCTPCRVGTWRSLEILDRLADDQGLHGDVNELKTLAQLMQDTSFCGLGQSVAIPMNSALLHFEAGFSRAETVKC
jgi:NADH:ubiquinone oxidoreductase subunit F (NADH-binding)/NADH:ubiquinone oxidoreductase subunit E